MIAKNSWNKLDFDEQMDMFLNFLKGSGFDVSGSDLRASSELRIMMQMAARIEALEAKVANI